MGEKRLRAGVASAATQALKPLYDTLGDLAVALDAVHQAPQLRAAADAKAQKILQDAHDRIAELHATTEARIIALHDAAQAAWQTARDAGWTDRQLTGAPLNLRPPALPRRRRTPRTTASAGGSEPTAGAPEPRIVVGELTAVT